MKYNLQRNVKPAHQLQALEQLRKFLDRHIRLNDDGLDGLRRQITAMARDHHVKVRFRVMAQINMAPCLVMHVETGSQ